MKPQLELLETREVKTVSLAGGILSVVGTDGNDDINLTLTADHHWLVEGQTFDAAQVQHVYVNAKAGWDSVVMELPVSGGVDANGEVYGDRLLQYCKTKELSGRSFNSIAGMSCALYINRTADPLSAFLVVKAGNGDTSAKGGIIWDRGYAPVLRTPVEPRFDPETPTDEDDWWIIYRHLFGHNYTGPDPED